MGSPGLPALADWGYSSPMQTELPIENGKSLDPPAKRAAFVPWDPQGIPLNFLITAHKQNPSSKALRENLGDAFLYRQNPVFRNIRDEYLKRGFRYRDRDFCGAFSFPLMALDEFIDARAIPYHRNFRWIERMQRIAPGKFTFSEVKRFDLKFNYLMHESAHLIAHETFFGETSLRDVPKNASGLLRILLGEAFANTSEAISSVFAQDTFGNFFLSANSYFVVRGNNLVELVRFVRRFSFGAASRVLLASFLYANYLYVRLDKEELQAIRRFAGLGPRAPVEALVKIAFGLSMGFRLNTTPLHLFKIGFDREIAKLMERDPLRMLLEEESLGLPKQVDQLVGALGRRLGPPPNLPRKIPATVKNH